MNGPQGGNQDDRITELKQVWSKANNAKDRINQHKNLWLSYFLDQQASWLDQRGKFNAVTDSELRKLRENKRVFPTFINLIKPAIHVIVAQRTQRQPIFKLSPMSAKQEVLYSSSAGNDLLKHYRTQTEYLRKDTEASYWWSVTGDVYKWTHPVPYDKTKTVPVEKVDDITGLPVLNEKGEKTFEEVPTEFDVVTTNLSWTEFTPPPGIQEIKDMPYVFINRYLDRKFVNDTYGLDLQERDVSDNFDAFTVQNMEVLGEKKGDQVLVIEYLEKPTNKYPRGRHMVFEYVEGHVLKDEDFPYWNTNPKTGAEEWGGYRIQHHTYDWGMVSHWGMGMPSAVVDIQKRINHLATILSTNIILTAGVKLGYPRGYKLPEEILDNEPKVFEYEPGSEQPHYMDPPQINQWIKTWFDQLKQEFNTIIGLHETTQGNEPARRMPFLGLQFQVETDLIKFRTKFKNYADTECLVGWDIIHSIRQFKPPWMLKVLTDSRLTELQAFLEDDMSDYQIIMEQESEMPESKAGRIGTILEIISQTGGRAFDLDSPMGRTKLLKAIGEGWTKPMIEHETEATELAEEENRRLMNGEPVQASIYNKHPLHVEVHLRIFNSPEYLTKYKGSSTEQEAQAHIIEHLNFQALGMAPPMPPPGAPPPGGPEQGPPPSEPGPAGPPQGGPVQ